MPTWADASSAASVASLQGTHHSFHLGKAREPVADQTEPQLGKRTGEVGQQRPLSLERLQRAGGADPGELQPRRVHGVACDRIRRHVDARRDDAHARGRGTARDRALGEVVVPRDDRVRRLHRGREALLTVGGDDPGGMEGVAVQHGIVEIEHQVPRAVPQQGERPLREEAALQQHRVPAPGAREQESASSRAQRGAASPPRTCARRPARGGRAGRDSDSRRGRAPRRGRTRLTSARRCCVTRCLIITSKRGRPVASERPFDRRPHSPSSLCGRSALRRRTQSSMPSILPRKLNK